MVASRRRGIALAVAVAYPLYCFAEEPVSPVAQATTPPAAPSPAPMTSATPSPPAQTLPPVEVTATRKRLDAARNGLSPDTGSSIYRLDRQDISNLPLGDSTPLN